jgi:DNA-binding MarR family transcriptional regulator
MTKNVVDAWHNNTVALFVFVALAGRRIKLGLSEVAALQLLHLEGPLTPKKLGTLLSIPSGTVTALVDRLEYKRLVTRKVSRDDRRSHSISVTELAVSSSMLNLAKMGRNLNLIAVNYTDAERSVLSKFLNECANSMRSFEFEQT